MWFERKGDARLGCCTTDDCMGAPVWRLEAGGVGSNYCSGCKEKIEHIRSPAAPHARQGSDVMSKWQPIEAAPKDGSEIWAFNGEQARMRWISGDGYALWVWADECLADVDPDAIQPTHWMPLPAPPSRASQGAEG